MRTYIVSFVCAMALSALCFAACSKVESDSECSGGAGGDDGHIHGSGGGESAGGAGGASLDAGHTCFLNSDCPPSLAPSCYTVHCDPVGKQTAPNSPVIGCYLLPTMKEAQVTTDNGTIVCSPQT